MFIVVTSDESGDDQLQPPKAFVPSLQSAAEVPDRTTTGHGARQNYWAPQLCMEILYSGKIEHSSLGFPMLLATWQRSNVRFAPLHVAKWIRPCLMRRRKEGPGEVRARAPKEKPERLQGCAGLLTAS